jgi:hypothetical protein
MKKEKDSLPEEEKLEKLPEEEKLGRALLVS